MVLSNLEPKSVFRFFEELCRIPHGSGNTAAASAWAEAFARERGLRCRRDEAGNVVIWKAASAGYEDHPAVMLQGHLDMVCVAGPGVAHDFTRDPLELEVDGGWVRAKGTTLGGDDGIAVAMVMALLDDGAVTHPPLEAVLTVDEEVGMLGATALDGSDLRARYLLNIDSEEEGVLTVGCAGGARCDLTGTFPAAPGGGVVCTLTVSGLQGGHSGVDINKGRANANKLLAECLDQLPGLRLISLRGGAQDNAIPGSAEAVFLLPAGAWEDYRPSVRPDPELEPHFSCTFAAAGGCGGPALSEEDSRRVVRLLLDAPNGIQSMEPDLPGQVRTSLNLGVMRLEAGELSLTWSVRSSDAGEKEALIARLEALAGSAGGSFSRRGEYPAWPYRKDSPLRETMVRVFRRLYGREPKVETIHAGLECGILADKVPGLDAVSFGPQMVDIHSDRERMSVESVQRTWEYLREVLREL